MAIGLMDAFLRRILQTLEFYRVDFDSFHQIDTGPLERDRHR